MTMQVSRFPQLWKGLALTHRRPKMSGMEGTLTVTESNFPALGEILNTDPFTAHSASPMLCVCDPGQTFPLFSSRSAHLRWRSAWLRPEVLAHGVSVFIHPFTRAAC